MKNSCSGIKEDWCCKAFALTGRLADCYYTQGAALGYELLPFQGVLLLGLLGLQPVLEPHAKLLFVI